MSLLDYFFRWSAAYRRWRGGEWTYTPGEFYEDGLWPGGIHVGDYWRRS